MKKIVVSLLLLTFTFATASAINVSSQTTYSSCNPWNETVNAYYYIPTNENITLYPDDTYWNTQTALIKNDSSVEIYNPHWIISQCNQRNRMSTIVRGWAINPTPQYPALVLRNEDWCVIGKPKDNYIKDPTNPSPIDAQIHYTIRFNLAWWGSETTPEAKFYYNDGDGYLCYPNWNKVSSNASCSKTTVKYWSNVHSHTWECLNYHVFWCGDGLVNGPGWLVNYTNWYTYEACDPEAPERKNRADWNSCTASCTIKYANSSCGSLNWTTEYNTQYPSQRITENTPWLCGIGQVVPWSLVYNKTTWKYTWSCKNETATAVSCSAQDLWCGDWAQNGWESCDDGTNNGTSNSTCSKTCTTVGSVSCGTSNGWKTYFSSRQSSPWLTATSAWMCAAWLTVGTPTIKWTDYHLEWTCSNANGASTTCKAYQEYCGDNIRQPEHESCDDGDKNGTSNSTCSKMCTIAGSVSCGTWDGWRTYFPSKQTSPWLTTTSAWMCAAWLTVGTPTIKWTDYHLEWTCSNANGASTTCKAYQEYCGDNIRQPEHESCDDGDKNGTSNSTCSKMCTIAGSVSCGTWDGWRTYFPSKQTSPWLTTTSAWMCAAWLTVGTPTIKWTDYHLEWTCSNANGTSTTCKAYQEYCGDKIRQSAYEECDYNDEGGNNFWNDGCDTSCRQKFKASDECDDTFYYTLRHKKKYTFYDTFIPTWIHYLYDFDVKFVEKDPYDYNRWPNPSFYWSWTLVDGVYMKVSDSRVVLESRPKYEVKDHPEVRSQDNLYIEYNIKYADFAYPTRPDDSQLKNHKECVYYEISRCGDGIIDTGYAETCDPKDTTHTWRWSGWCDEETCQPITSVVSPVCNSQYNGQTLSNLVEWNYLCTVWTVSDFKYDANTRKWTWKCNNAWSSVACYANKPQDGTLRIEKTLTWKKTVENTGEILTWQVRVRSEWWESTDFEIQDIVPFALSYEGYRVLKNNDNLQLPNKPSWPVHTATWNVYTWNVTWTLQKNHELILEIKTKVVKMPEAEDDYRNVACVIKGNNKKCDDDKPSWSPNLRIKKSFTDNTKHKVVRIWDLIAYKVRFGNSWDAQAKITSIKDFLPKNVKYITGSIHINRTSTHSYGTQSWEMNLINGFNVVDGVRIEIYGWMILQPGDEWYIILTWQVTSKFTWNRTNFACIYLNDTLIDCDDAKHDIKEQENVSCKPALSPSSFEDVCYDEAWEFSTTVTCKASENSDIEIRCDWNRIKSATNVEQITWTCSSDEHNKYHKVQCKINGSFTWVNWEVCENSFRRNTKDCSTCFVAWTKVRMADWSQKNIEDVEIWEKILWSNGTINTVLWYDRPVLWNRHLWSINGSEYFVSDEHPFMTTEGWKSFNPEMTKLEVDLNTTELKIGDVLVTDNGLEVIESVDYINADYNTPLYNFMLDWDHTYYANNYLVHNKGDEPKPDPDPDSYCDKHPDNPMCELANPKCFNVNEWNFSIESGEYLPFYFNVYKEADSTYKYKFIQNKDDECELWTVDLWSLKCEYRILDPYNNIVYSGDNIDCLQPGEDRNSSKPLIEAWKEKQKEHYTIDVDDTGLGYWPTISRTKSKEWNTTVLWEYKFQLVVYQYDQCKDDGSWKTYIMDDPVCQSNFVLTDSYTVQKTPSGNLTASTNTLKKFREADGERVEFSTYLNTISTSDYNPNWKVEEAMKAFSDKYEKLAVTINKNGTTMKKVPWKNIYFIDWNFSIKNWTFSKPFTLVQTNPDKTIKIEWDITNLNMMILTEWDIEFIWNCEKNQNVKWIFYAKGDLKRSWVKKNNNLSNNVWCTKWWLNIKWVLIWYNFNELMNKSRSHLENWFESKGHAQELTKKIMNWASVVVEYSPSIFTKSTMPPGAEDFTTALSIYKN